MRQGPSRAPQAASTPTIARCWRRKSSTSSTSCCRPICTYPVARDVLESGPAPAARKADGADARRTATSSSAGQERTAASWRSATSCGMSSLWGKVKELIDAGAIGEPLYALIELWRRPYRLGLRRLALRHQPRRQLDPRGADPLLRPGPLVFRGRRRAGLGLRRRQRQAAGPSGAARQFLGDPRVPRRPLRRHLADAGGVGASPDRQGHRHRRRDVGDLERRDGPHVRADVLG